MNDREYERKLNEICDRIYEASDDLGYSWEQLASHARLAVATIYRLGNRETKLPRLRTVLSLAKAVGLEFVVIGIQRARHAG